MFFLLFFYVSVFVFVCERCSRTHIFTAIHLLKFIYAILLFTFVQMTLFPGSLHLTTFFHFTNLPKDFNSITFANFFCFLFTRMPHYKSVDDHSGFLLLFHVLFVYLSRILEDRDDTEHVFAWWLKQQNLREIWSPQAVVLMPVTPLASPNSRCPFTGGQKGVS